MATNDKRRTDVRNQVLENPVWITSAEVTYEDTGDNVILFDFVNTGQIYVIHHCICQVTTLFAGGTPLLDLGSGTIPTPDDPTLSIVDADEYIAQADITATSTGVYGWATSDAYTAWAAGTLGLAITGAQATVPVVYATVSASLTAGAARFHMLISSIPGTRS